MHIRNQLDQHDQVAHFERVLRRAGYRDEHAQYYRRSYSVGSIEKHQITANSPVLKPTTLGDLPATVKNITYTLDVYGMEFSEVTKANGRSLLNCSVSDRSQMERMIHRCRTVKS